VSWPAGVESMDARRVRVRSVRKRRRWSFRRRVADGGPLDEGDRGSKGVGRVEGKDVLTNGFSLSEESELVDMVVGLGLVTVRRFGMVDGDIVVFLFFHMPRIAKHLSMWPFRDKKSGDDQGKFKMNVL